MGPYRDHKLREGQLESITKALSNHGGDIIEPQPLHFFLMTPHIAAQQHPFMLSMVSFKGKAPVPAGEEEGELGEYRGKLLMFLEISSYYDPGRLICDFPFDGGCL